MTIMMKNTITTQLIMLDINQPLKIARKSEFLLDLSIEVRVGGVVSLFFSSQFRTV